MQYPVPKVAGIDPPGYDIFGYPVVSAKISGSGFYPGGIIHFGVWGDSGPLPAGISAQQLDEFIPIGTPQDTPGWIDISVSSPTGGPGGGTSNTLQWPIIHSYDGLALAGGTGYFLLPNVGVQRININSDSIVNTAGGVADPNGIAIDEKTGDVLESSYVGAGLDNVGIFDPLLNFLGNASTADATVVQSVAAGDGYGCVSIPADKSVSIFPLKPLNSQTTMPSGAVTGSFPWPVLMTAVGGNPVCLTYDVTDGTLSEVGLKSDGSNYLILQNSVANLQPYSQATQHTTFSGWQLISFDLPRVTVTSTSTAYPNVFASSSVKIDPNTSTISVSISPLSIPYAGTSPEPTQQFTATVTGTTDTAVNWYVEGVLGGNSTVGTISSSGLFTPPEFPFAPLIDITAVSVADPTKSATAYQLVGSCSASGGSCEVLLGISPENLSIAPGASQQFTSVMEGASDSSVSWSVNGISGGNAAVGTITSTGLYTAPTGLASAVAGTIALLSQADGVLIFFDSKTLTELLRVSIPGLPLLAAADVPDGAAIVASADLKAARTDFYRVDVATGDVTLLNSSSDLLATGFGVSSDGKNLYVCMRTKCETLPNN